MEGAVNMQEISKEVGALPRKQLVFRMLMVTDVQASAEQIARILWHRGFNILGLAQVAS